MSHALLKRLDDFIPTLGGWCTSERAQDLAMMVLALRPARSVVLGVWAGRDTFALALAHQHLGHGTVLAIDPWSAPASIEGQGEADAGWWGNQQMHEQVYGEFIQKRRMLGLEEVVNVVRAKSDDVEPVPCGICLVDGNHGPQAINDTERWAPMVAPGGILYLDDLNWSGGAVLQAAERVRGMGFTELFKRDTGAFFQRVK